MDKPKKPTKQCLKELERIIWRLEAWQIKWNDRAPNLGVGHIKSSLIGVLSQLEKS